MVAKERSRSKEEEAKSQASSLKTRVSSDESEVLPHGFIWLLHLCMVVAVLAVTFLLPLCVRAALVPFLRILEIILIAVIITFAVAAATYVNQQPPPKPKKLTERRHNIRKHRHASTGCVTSEG